jgi:hypothetical protein
MFYLQEGKIYKYINYILFMLWEKKNTKIPEKRGYLYLRETVYVRDGRTLKRKPKKLGDGSGAKNRGKYSVKKDTYCGKIIIKKMVKFTSFMSFLNLDSDKYLDYRLHSEFSIILEDFISYLLDIFEIDRDDFENKKRAYEIAGGYLSLITVDFLNRFIVRIGFDEKVEIERFANRCVDCGIFDNDVIIALFTKIAPEEYTDVREELESLKKETMEASSHDGLMGFMKVEHSRD